MNKLLQVTMGVICLVMMTACASNARVQSDFDDSLDFSHYETFNFRSQTEFENPNFHELLGLTFSAAVEEQMLARGYVKSDNPGILIDVSVDVEDTSRAPTRAHGCPSYSTGGNARISASVIAGKSMGTFCRYTQGQIKIHMFDKKLNRNLWEGAAYVRIDERERGTLLDAFIVNDVNTMFTESPFRPRQPTVWKLEKNRVVGNEHSRR